MSSKPRVLVLGGGFAGLEATFGIYVPWRFGSGEPFHAGFAWDAMDLGLKVMSKFLAK